MDSLHRPGRRGPDSTVEGRGPQPLQRAITADRLSVADGQDSSRGAIEPQRAVLRPVPPLYSLGWLRTELNSDGFDGLFLNLAGAVVPDAIASARRAGAAELADLVEAAARVAFGETFPSDVDERQRALLALSETAREALSELDERYYDLEASTDLDVLMRTVAAP